MIKIFNKLDIDQLRKLVEESVWGSLGKRSWNESA